MEEFTVKELKYLNKLNVNKRAKKHWSIYIMLFFFLISIIHFLFAYKVANDFDYSMKSIIKLYFITPYETRYISSLELAILSKFSGGFVYFALGIFMYFSSLGEIFKENLLKKCLKKLKEYEQIL